ncbi:MAG: hypothetical protein IKL50_04680 [Bacteroidales bacterium]|nr:hypothetical protein [Bacteroidales bacterium]
MNTVSKEIIDKLRQLSDLLVVIKDSGNNTPQILKELAVEKCSEIYKTLSLSEDVIEYKIDAPQTEVEIEDVEKSQKSVDIDPQVEEIYPSSDNITDSEEENELTEENSEECEEIEVDNSGYDYTPQDVKTEVQEFEIEENIPLTEEEDYFDTQDTEEEETLEEEEDTYVYSDLENDNEPPFDVEYIEEKEEVEESVEEDEGSITTNKDIDLFASKESFKKCNHKKIRSVLSINDIFLYKRELFGNSDVDMTDMFDGIDEAESFDDAMEYINEYFASDVETEEMVIEFIDRVKQCFE